MGPPWRDDIALLFSSLLPLFFVVAIAFATATIAACLSHGGDASLAAAVFQSVFEAMSLSFGLLFDGPSGTST